MSRRYRSKTVARATGKTKVSRISSSSFIARHANNAPFLILDTTACSRRKETRTINVLKLKRLALGGLASVCLLACRTGVIFLLFFRRAEASTRRTRSASHARREGREKLFLVFGQNHLV